MGSTGNQPMRGLVDDAMAAERNGVLSVSLTARLSMGRRRRLRRQSARVIADGKSSNGARDGAALRTTILGYSKDDAHGAVGNHG